MLYRSATVYSSKQLLPCWNCGLVIQYSQYSSFRCDDHITKFYGPELFPNRKVRIVCLEQLCINPLVYSVVSSTSFLCLPTDFLQTYLQTTVFRHHTPTASSPASVQYRSDIRCKSTWWAEGHTKKMKRLADNRLRWRGDITPAEQQNIYWNEL